VIFHFVKLFHKSFDFDDNLIMILLDMFHE
jgi:hypothetical protein